MPGRIWLGTGLQVAGRVWSAVCTLWILRLAGEGLSGAEFGRFTFYLSLFTWLDSFVALGTAEVAIQRTASDPAAIPAVLSAARRIRVIAGAIGIAAVAALGFGFDEPGAGWVVLAACYPVTHALELSTLVWRNRISWARPVAIRAVAAGASLAAVAAAIELGFASPARLLAAVAAGSALGNLLLHLFARSELPPAPAGLRPAPGVFQAAWPLGLSSLCAQAYFYVDNVFIRVLLGEAELGPYNVAVRAMSLLLMLAQYATLSALPWLARSAAEGRLESSIVRIGPWLFAAAGLICGAVWPFTGRLLDALVPGSAGAAQSLRWLLGAVLAIHVGSVMLSSVVALGDNRSKLWIQACGLILNVALNFWAVPKWGIAGAGMTTFATEAFVAIAAVVCLARHGVRPFKAAYAPLWVFGPVAFLAARWIAERLPLQ